MLQVAKVFNRNLKPLTEENFLMTLPVVEKTGEKSSPKH